MLFAMGFHNPPCLAQPVEVVTGNLLLLRAQSSDSTEEAAQYSSPTFTRVRISQFHMGMMMHVTLWATNEQHGRDAARACFARIKEVNRIMSDYEPDSELSAFCRQAGQGPVSLSKELFHVLKNARRLAELTDGKYDPTIGPLTRLWRTAREQRKLPSTIDINEARSLVDYRKLRLDVAARTGELMREGMQLDLGSIAKGYAADEAIRVLREHGVSRAAFEAGGDTVLSDPPPGAVGWPVELPGTTANEKLSLSNCAVSVSGSTAQFINHQGRIISHIIEPTTGWGTSTEQTCVVVASDGITADPLATIASLMPPASFEVFLSENFPQVHYGRFKNSQISLLGKARIAPPLSTTTPSRDANAKASR